MKREVNVIPGYFSVAVINHRALFFFFRWMLGDQVMYDILLWLTTGKASLEKQLSSIQSGNCEQLLLHQLDEPRPTTKQN